MGTNDDTSETNTSVYGATKYFIEKIREKVPNAVLGFVLSPRQDWGSNDAQGLRDLNGAREAIKTVCDEYGVPYIDMSTQSGITVDMLPDGIHIKSEQSQKLYYHAMRRFMMGL
jgi:isocitrate lyase